MSKRGFFAGSLLASKPPPGRVSKCGVCGLHKTCRTPKMPVGGKGELGILVIGDAPCMTDDVQGTPWSGRCGKLLRRVLDGMGVDLERDCWSTNAVRCQINREPTDKEIDYCRANLMRTVEELKPKVCLCLGGRAVRALIGGIWRESPGGIAKWQGWDIPCQQLNSWVVPTYSPSFLLAEDFKVLDRVFEAAVERAVEHESRPFEVVPDEKGEIELVFDTNEAARILHDMTRRGGAVAFDYETNMLKPDSKEAEIVSCSVCWMNQQTIAYPWQGKAIAATRKLLRSPLLKIASNLKFEERWTRSKLKTRVRNWEYCTMTGAHILDNRPGVTSVKFQSFVLLGSDIWDDHIAQFLRSENGKGGINQILEQVDLGDLLLYNGLDSLLEYRVALKQMMLMDYPIPKEMRP